MIIIITLQQLYTFIITYIVFKLGSVIYSNVLKEVSSAQRGCIYLYSKNTCLIQEGGLKIGQKKYYFNNLLILS